MKEISRFIPGVDGVAFPITTELRMYERTAVIMIGLLFMPEHSTLIHAQGFESAYILETRNSDSRQWETLAH